jgi:hypothetical protein
MKPYLVLLLAHRSYSQLELIDVNETFVVSSKEFNISHPEANQTPETIENSTTHLHLGSSPTSILINIQGDLGSSNASQEMLDLPTDINVNSFESILSFQATDVS